MPSPSLSAPNPGRRPGCLSPSRRPLFADSLAFSESLLTNSSRRCPRTRRPAGTPTGRHCSPRPQDSSSALRVSPSGVRPVNSSRCARRNVPARRLLREGSMRRTKRTSSLCACFALRSAHFCSAKPPPRPAGADAPGGADEVIPSGTGTDRGSSSAAQIGLRSGISSPAKV